LKRLYGERLFSRRFDAISVEMWMKAQHSNIWLIWATYRTFAAQPFRIYTNQKSFYQKNIYKNPKIEKVKSRVFVLMI
jgi:hypothetical protein